jgi:hypothetical protein
MCLRRIEEENVKCLVERVIAMFGGSRNLWDVG